VFADQCQRNGVILGQHFWRSEWRHRCSQSRRSSGLSCQYRSSLAHRSGSATSRGRRLGAPGAARTSAASSWSREVQRIHDQNSSARVERACSSSRHSQRELVHRWSPLSLSAAPPRLTRPVFEGSQPAGGGASRDERISEMASGSMHNGCLTRSYLAVEWSVTNTWLTIALWPVRPLGPGGWRGRSGQQGCQG
jgi:hypothetical protein